MFSPLHLFIFAQVLSPFYRKLLGTTEGTPDRIEDDKTGERQSGSPSSDAGTLTDRIKSGGISSSPIMATINNPPRYDPTSTQAPVRPRSPLEDQISSEKNEYNRLVAPPPPMTLLQRIGGLISGGIPQAVTGTPMYGPAATLRDRAEERKRQEQKDLADRIDANMRALSGQQESENRLREQEEFQRGLWGQKGTQASALEAQKEQGRVGLEGVKQEGRTALESQKEQFGQKKLDQQYKEFQSTDQYRRWKAQLDNSTKLHIAQLQQSKAPAALMQTAVFADGGIKSLNDAEAAMAKLEQAGVMGQSWAQNKVEDWIFGKGAVDPSLSPDIRKTIGELRTSLNLAASAMTRAHTQRGSKEVYDDLKSRLGPGQDWAALRGAISESQDMLGSYVTAASDANITRIRAGANAPPPPPPPASSKGNRITLDQLKQERRQPGF